MRADFLPKPDQGKTKKIENLRAVGFQPVLSALTDYLQARFSTCPETGCNWSHVADRLNLSSGFRWRAGSLSQVSAQENS